MNSLFMINCSYLFEKPEGFNFYKFLIYKLFEVVSFYLSENAHVNLILVLYDAYTIVENKIKSYDPFTKQDI